MAEKKGLARSYYSRLLEVGYSKKDAAKYALKAIKAQRVQKLRAAKLAEKAGQKKKLKRNVAETMTKMKGKK